MACWIIGIFLIVTPAVPTNIIAMAASMDTATNGELMFDDPRSIFAKGEYVLQNAGGLFSWKLTPIMAIY